MWRLLVLITLTLITPTVLFARPVSYPGGWTLMQRNNGDRNLAHLHYSPTRNDSIGYKIEFRRDTDSLIHYMQYNRLLKRWNMPSAQANTYLKNAIGYAHDTDVDSFAMHSEFAADYETRRIFVGYGSHFLNAPEIEREYSQHARIGVAPYLNSYEEWATWIMFEVGHTPTDEHNITLTPIIRVFKSAYLFEAGVSSEKEVMFNAIIRF